MLCLQGQFVDQIACGAFHVVALTSSQNIYAWGKGANGRLGMGDTKDRDTPALVEALKDKQVGFERPTVLQCPKWQA
jgi:alpha-tubulin suppressor-like RCC1 family protein